MGLTKTPVMLPTMLSPLGMACARMNLTAVYDILLKTGYKDEEGAENEVSFFHVHCVLSIILFYILMHLCLASYITVCLCLISSYCFFLEAVIPRVDTTSARYVEYKEVCRYCL